MNGVAHIQPVAQYKQFQVKQYSSSTHRSDARSPYAKNYRTNLTHDQREHLSHRQSISRLPRREFEDRYIALLDEYYAIKKENAANNQKIKKMATKLLRLSAEGKSRGLPFPQQLAPNENLEIQIIRLEAYNSLLKDRLNAIIKNYSGGIQSTATSTMRRPASCSNLSIKRKIILSEDDLNLLEIPEPPTIVSKTDNRSSIGSGSAITTEPKMSTTTTAATKTMATNKLHHPTYQQSQSSIIFENDQISNANEPIEVTASIINGNSSINNLKNCIQKLQSDLNDARESNDRLKTALEERITDQLIERRTAETTELVELRRTMVECEMELHELREQYLLLKTKAEHDLTKEHKKIDELTQIVKDEMDRNTNLSKDLQKLRHATAVIESGQNHENSDTKFREELKSTGAMEQTNDSHRNDDLIELLNEAKLTILELQREIESLKSEIEQLRQQNRTLATQRDSPQKHPEIISSAKELKPAGEDGSAAMPLQPIVIVNDNNKIEDNSTNANLITNERNDGIPPAKINYSNSKSAAKNGRNQMPSDQTSQSDNTYVPMKNKSRKQKKVPMKHIVARTTYSTTDSEISSLDSDDQFRTFQDKNRKIQSSMILLGGNQPVGMSFSQRMSLLEKVAYYRPLANVPPNAGNVVEQHRYLACDCKGFECDQQIEAFYEEIRRAVKNARAIMLQEIQNNPQVGGQHQDVAAAAAAAPSSSSSTAAFNKQFDDTSECREFLRVQYNLNNLYKQELELICKTCKQQRQELLKQIDMLKAKLQNYEDKVKSSGLASEMLEIEKAARMLYIDSNEGSFEFHISSFRPTKEGRPLLSCRHGELSSLYVSWHFYEHKFESKTSIRLPPNYTFDSSHIYAASIDKEFLMRLQNEKVPINLFATAGSTATLMGSVNINLAEVLLFPQNKIQLITKVMSVVSADECEHTDRFCGCGISVAKPKHLGNLTLWFRLTCELDVLKSLFTDFDQWRSQTNQSVATESEIGHQQQQQQQPPYSYRSHDEQQQKIEQQKTIEPIESSTQIHDQSTLPDKNIISIIIHCLRFNETFQFPTEDDNTIAMNKTQIHIECNFLGSRRLKTSPKSLSRGIDQLQFNFTQSYPRNERNLQRLSNILKDPDHSIKFTLIETTVSSLPEPDKSIATITSDDESKHDCHEIGFGLLHFSKFVHGLDSDSELREIPHTFTIPILSKRPPYQNIGQLDISIANVSTIKMIQQQN